MEKGVRINFFVIVLVILLIGMFGLSIAMEHKAEPARLLAQEREKQKQEEIVHAERDYSIQEGDFFPVYMSDIYGYISPIEGTWALIATDEESGIFCGRPAASENDRVFVLGLLEEMSDRRWDKFLVEYLPAMMTVEPRLPLLLRYLEICQPGATYSMTRKQLKDAAFEHARLYSYNHQDAMLVRQGQYMLSQKQVRIKQLLSKKLQVNK